MTTSLELPKQPLGVVTANGRRLELSLSGTTVYARPAITGHRQEWLVVGHVHAEPRLSLPFQETTILLEEPGLVSPSTLRSTLSCTLSEETFPALRSMLLVNPAPRASRRVWRRVCDGLSGLGAGWRRLGRLRP